MTTEDVECYSSTYSDLNGMDPRKHYITVGKDQGRQQHCGKNLTDYEASQYINRYPDIQYEYGVEEEVTTSYETLYQNVREHYISHGQK